MQTIVNLGTGGADLNGQNGSTTSADSNDALFLDWPGDNAGNYVYLPDTNASRLSVPDAVSLRVVDDLEIVLHLALDDYTPSAAGMLIQKGAGLTGYTFRLFILTDGDLRFQVRNAADTTTHAADSTVSLTTVVTDSQPVWVKVTKEASTGDVSFYTATDGATWTQLGATASLGYTGSAYLDTTGEVRISGRTSANFFAGKVYRVILKNGVDGTSVLDVDTSLITSGAATSFLDATGNHTVTIERATSGRKSVAVVSPVWLFGTDDYMEVADNALLDFGASDDFTVLAAHRVWNTQGTDDTLIAKKANTTNTTQGWSLSAGSSTALEGQAHIGDGSAGVTAVSDARVVGALTVTTAVRDVAADTLTVYRNGTAGSAVTDTTTASLSNGEVLRIARLSGAGTEYSHMELFGVAVFRRALTADEIASISSYYANKVA